MHILFITPYVPSHIRVRPFNLIKYLSTTHDISLVSLLCDEYEQELVKSVSNFCASVDLVPLPKSQAYTNCLRALPSLTPLRVAYYQSPTFIQRIQRVILEQSIDVLHGELIKTVPTLHAISGQETIPIVYDSVDCISSYLQQQWSTARNPLQKLFVYSELQKMRRYESQELKTFDRIVITSKRDRNHLIDLGVPRDHIHVLPNGVDIEYFTPPTTPRDKHSLVFCAKLDYYPNSQGILHFCQETLPLIWKRQPEVRLTIVGSNPPQSVRNLAQDERITITGYVPDIRPYLARASIALSPLIVAAGIQNKVLEALAMGAPTVATPQSCSSLQVKNNADLLIAEGGQAYADAVLELLENAQLAQSLSRAGRRYVEQHHSWATTSNILSELYYELASKRHPHDLMPDVTLLR
jgi:polysaccharide biosynthesis protein PslH